MKKLFASLLLLLIATPVFAQTSVRDYPALSLARLTVGGRVEHVWWEGKDFAPRTQFNVKKEFAAGLVASYGLIPNVALTGRGLYHLDTKAMVWAIGVNFLLFDGLRYTERR